MNNIERHKKLCDGMHETYIAKNNDYGNSFHETYTKYGFVSAMVRISDKFHRLESLIRMPAEKRMVKDESIRDTLIDMANYCLMAVSELDEQNEQFNCQDKSNV